VNQDNDESREQAAARRVTAALSAHQVASDIFDDAIANFLGVNRTDARCLDLVGREGRITAGRLAESSGLTTGAVTIVIDRLSSAGYVRRVRDPDDRRKVYVEMTPELGDIRARIASHFERLMPAILAEFSPKQIEGIVALLELSSLLNRAVSDVLKEHIAPKSATVAARQAQARAFERAARGAVSRAAAGLPSKPTS
jgi:DNA-binding MarR family transcriptional regulator